MNFATARKNMLDSQIRTNRVDDPLVLDALTGLEREHFLPKAMRGIAYVDDSIPLGNGRYVMRPSILARMLQEAEAGADDVVLVVGCGTGYGIAALSKLVSTVVAVESNADLAARAARNLTEIGIDNAVVIEGPMTEGCPTQAPFDIIFFSGAVDAIPDSIVEQLGEGGRLIAVERSPAPGTGRAVVVSRIGGSVGRREAFDANLSYLPGFEPKEKFTF